MALRERCAYAPSTAISEINTTTSIFDVRMKCKDTLFELPGQRLSPALPKHLPDKLFILHLVEVSIKAIPRQELFMAPFLLDFAVVKNNDLIRLLDR